MAAAPPGHRVIGRYALYASLASGGMASVHLGRLLGPVGFARTVAIKRLHDHYARDPDFVSMFLDEARLAARIHHPNVVPTIDVVAADGELFLVMEYVHGETLARMLRPSGRAEGTAAPRVAVASAILAGVLHGLHAAHEATSERGEPLDIVHRDMSPQNVIVGVDGIARVLDFGIAKAFGRSQTTRDGALKGKLPYMSPEQIKGLPLDRRSDVFAASVVLWEMLTAQRLFSADNEGAVVEQVLSAPVRPPSEVASSAPFNLDAIVMRGLARDRNARFSTAREMALAIEAEVPPATPAQVSRWVEDTAHAELAKRARIVLEVEGASTPDPMRPSSALIQIRQTSEVLGDTPPATAPAHHAAARSEAEQQVTKTATPIQAQSTRWRPQLVPIVLGAGFALVVGSGVVAIAQPWRRASSVPIPPALATDPATVSCRADAPFGTPTPLREVEGFSARLSPDELTLYFERTFSMCDEPDAGHCRCDEKGNCCDHDGGCAEGYFIFLATRPSVQAPFSAPVSLPGLNVDTVNESPSIDATGLNLYFDVTKAGKPRARTRTLYVSTRSNTSSPFLMATKEPLTGALNASQAFVLPDSSYLYYTSFEGPGLIYRARLVHGNPEAPQLVPGLPSGIDAPTPTPDQKTIYFQAHGPDGKGHVFVATRADGGSPFGDTHLVPELYLPGMQDTPSWVSSDDCHLYFDRWNGGGEGGIYVAARSPL